MRSAAWLVLPASLAVVVADAARVVLPGHESALIFMLAVFLAASRGGLRPGIGTAFLCSLAYDYFFLDPVFSFSLADPDEVFALLAFLSVAALTGSLAGRLREETNTARRQAATLQSLYSAVGQLSGARSLEPLLEAAIGQIAAAAGGSAVLLRSQGEALLVCASAPDAVELEKGDLESARRAMQSATNALAVAPGWPGARFEFRPLTVRGRTVAVIGFAPSVSTPAAWRGADQAVTALFQQITLASERIAAEEEGALARSAAQEERLRSALLSSVSHDLRTPLATILGSITSLRHLGDALPPADRDDLMAVIEEETERLSRFVGNLLHMTRLEAGIDLRRDWIEGADVVRAAVERARVLFRNRTIGLQLDPDAPAIRADAVLLEQVLLNLIDNAVRYSPPDRPVEVRVQRCESTLVLTVTDEGPGIPEEDLARMFEKFQRGSHAEIAGAGLGLAICRGIVTAFGGTIVAESPLEGGRGTRLRIDLPISAQPADSEFRDV